MQALVITARANGRPLSTQLLIQLLHRLSRGLDACAARLAQSSASEEPTAPLELEFRRDPKTGHSVLFENGERRFTFLQGLERL
jgi:hypothetical protein